MSKYGVLSGPYFPVFSLNTGKYGPEKTPYLDTFHAVYTKEKPISYEQDTVIVKRFLANLQPILAICNSFMRE